MGKSDRLTHAAVECGITLRHSENAEVRRSAIRAIRAGIAALRNPENPFLSLRALSEADQAMQSWLAIPKHDPLPEIVESGIYPLVKEVGGNAK